MTISEALEKRCSNRRYIPLPLEEETAAKLNASVENYNAEAGLRLQLIVNNGRAFNGITKSYGMFTGVTNYFALVGREDASFQERCGYYGEKLVLEATSLGLGTCWVGGTYNKRACVCELGEGESICCVITVGYTPESFGVREKLIYKMVHRKTKTAEDMSKAVGEAPQWFYEGMKAVQRAPSAANRQPVLFRFKDNRVTAELTEHIACSEVDLGIAKLHFELGAGGGNWQWGSGGEFTR